MMQWHSIGYKRVSRSLLTQNFSQRWTELGMSLDASNRTKSFLGVPLFIGDDLRADCLYRMLKMNTLLVNRM